MKVDNGFTLDDQAEGGTDIAPLGEILLEGGADGFEAAVATAVNREVVCHVVGP